MSGVARVLVVGGQRSGKSRYAERRALELSSSPIYLATATAGDIEMAERIALHRQRRGAEWRLVEESLAIPDTLRREGRPGGAILLDCLTLWLSNLFDAGGDVAAETERLSQAVGDVAGAVVIVSNEVGSGVIPNDALSRQYADALGTLNQRIGEAVDEVVLVVAGQPLVIKGDGQ